MNVPKELKLKVTDKHRTVLAYGEVTGHAHAFYGNDTTELSTDIEETRTFLKIKATDALTHEEHAPHTFEPGMGEVIVQREYTMGNIRRVAD